MVAIVALTRRLARMLFAMWRDETDVAEDRVRTDRVLRRTVALHPPTHSAHRHSSHRCDQPGVGEFSMTAGGEIRMTVDTQRSARPRPAGAPRTWAVPRAAGRGTPLRRSPGSAGRPSPPALGLHATTLNHAVRNSLAARGKSPAAFDRRCIPLRGVVHRSNTAGIFPLLALLSGRIADLGATRGFTTDC